MNTLETARNEVLEVAQHINYDATALVELLNSNQSFYYPAVRRRLTEEVARFLDVANEAVLTDSTRVFLSSL